MEILTQINIKSFKYFYGVLLKPAAGKKSGQRRKKSGQRGKKSGQRGKKSGQRGKKFGQRGKKSGQHGIKFNVDLLKYLELF